MDNRDKHSELGRDKDPLSMINGSSVSWKRSKEDVWDTMQTQMVERENRPVYNLRARTIRLAVAAVVVILLGIPTLMRFYTKTIDSVTGEHLSVQLPDGSSVEMNAETVVKYKPMWWKFSRDVKLYGEAFFEVIPGSDFSVKSEMATTEVVGTSFNIIARENKYEVTCITGKVKVSKADSNSELFLEPNQKAVLISGGDLQKHQNIVSEQSITWTNGEFFFTSRPLEDVFREIERQFGIIVINNLTDEFIYTGNFSRNQNVEAILELVCRPFGIKFEAVGSGRYLIRKDEQKL